MKPLGDIIQWHRVRFHQHADNTQLYISIFGQKSHAVEVLSRCPETAWVCIERNRLRFNPSVPVRQSNFGFRGLQNPLAVLVHNLKSLLESQLLFKKKGSNCHHETIYTTFTLSYVSAAIIPGMDGINYYQSCFRYPLNRLLQCTLFGGYI